MTRLLIISIIISTISCANPVAPTGGPKDKKPPVITNVIIDSVKNAATIQYDENIRFQNKVVLIPEKKNDKVDTKEEKQSIQIQLKTYTEHINLGESIKDLNENNIGVYPMIHLHHDTQIVLKTFKYPSFIKANFLAQSFKDSFIYKHKTNQDTVFQCCLTQTGNRITITLDENKNNRTDSFEWSISSSDTILKITEPTKPKIQLNQIDSTQLLVTGTNIYQILPLINKPYKIFEDTILLHAINQRIISKAFYINRNKSLKFNTNRIYKYQDSIIQEANNNQKIPSKTPDSLKYDTINVGLISLKNTTNKDVIISIYKKERKIFQKGIHPTVSLHHYIQPGKYHYLIYEDIDKDYKLSEADQITTYFKEIAIIKDVENHIDVVQGSEKLQKTTKSTSQDEANSNTLFHKKIKPE